MNTVTDKEWETKDNFNRALEAAETMHINDDAVQSEVGAAVDALFQAMLNLRYKADKSVLRATIASAEEVDLSGYEDTSVERLKNALAQAKAAEADKSISREDQNLADAALRKLSEAVEGLKNQDGTPANLAVNGDGSITDKRSSQNRGQHAAGNGGSGPATRRRRGCRCKTQSKIVISFTLFT